MLEQSTINILLLASVVMLFILYIFFPQRCGVMEGYSQESLEAIQDIASVYNNGTLTVNNLHVTKGFVNDGDMQVAGNSTLGQWSIRNDRIGIPNRGDMNLAADSWIRLFTYNGGDYPSNGGYAGQNLWCANGSLSASSIGTGSLSTNSINIANSGTMAGGNLVSDNMAIGIQSSRGGYLVDGGGWSACNPTKSNNYEAMKIIKLPIGPNPTKVFNNCCGC